MKEYTSKGIICIKDELNIQYNLCLITYKLNEDESFEYCFEPNYNVIDLLPENIFDTIPGLDFSLRKKKYIRKNIIPTFISERVISENREDYNKLLQERNMEFMDPIQYMIRSKKYYSGDKLFVVDYKEIETIEIDIINSKNNSFECNKKILSEICKGNNVIINDLIINDDNRKEFYTYIYMLYSKTLKSNKKRQIDGINIAKLNNKYKGRKPVRIEEFKILDMADRVKNKELTSKQAADKLGISIYKYYRELKKLQK